MFLFKRHEVYYIEYFDEKLETPMEPLIHTEIRASNEIVTIMRQGGTAKPSNRGLPQVGIGFYTVAAMHKTDNAYPLWNRGDGRNTVLP